MTGNYIRDFGFQHGSSCSLRHGEYYRFRVHFYFKGKAIYVPFKLNNLPTFVTNKYGVL